VAEIPRPAERAAVTQVAEASIAIGRGGKYLLRRRGDTERWAGLWDFLRLEVVEDASTNGSLSSTVRRQLVKRIHEHVGLDVDPPEPVHVLRHSVTRYRITLHCLRAACIRGRLRRDNGPLAWVKPSEFDHYPLSVTGRKFARILAPTAPPS
jgi:A/G-specific adenine glycosylase